MNQTDGRVTQDGAQARGDVLVFKGAVREGSRVDEKNVSDY